MPGFMRFLFAAGALILLVLLVLALLSAFGYFTHDLADPAM